MRARGRGKVCAFSPCSLVRSTRRRPEAARRKPRLTGKAMPQCALQHHILACTKSPSPRVTTRRAATVSLPGCGRVRRFRLAMASARGSARGRAREHRQSPSAVAVLQVVVVAPLVAGLQVVVVEKPPSSLPGTLHRSRSPGAHPCALQHHWKKRPWKARGAYSPPPEAPCIGACTGALKSSCCAVLCTPRVI